MKLLEVLACPKCSGALSCTPSERGPNGEIAAGTMRCQACQQSYPIRAGIPRFVAEDNYANSFGYQWNRFRLEQIDSSNGTKLSEQRLRSETGWADEWLRGKWVLDAGCGAGRFLDVAGRTGAEVVGLDISNAIDAAKSNVTAGGLRHNVHFVQASIYELPFRPGAFDACYCIGVLQHTPDPEKALRMLPKILRRGGRLAVTIYERKPWTKLNAKYLVRPLTKRLKKETLLKAISGVMPWAFPLTDVMFRLPVVGRLCVVAIPVANYVNEHALTRRQRYQWAILDTFDMLSPQYDQPRTQVEVEQTLTAAGMTGLRRRPNSGLNIVGERGD